MEMEISWPTSCHSTLNSSSCKQSQLVNTRKGWFWNSEFDLFYIGDWILRLQVWCQSEFASVDRFKSLILSPAICATPIQLGESSAALMQPHYWLKGPQTLQFWIVFGGEIKSQPKCSETELETVARSWSQHYANLSVFIRGKVIKLENSKCK